MGSGILTFFVSIIIFLLVVLVHEFGHFIVAKNSGIKVNEFSIGMGPLILSNNKGETQYSFRAIPMGGYVAMEGEEEDSQDKRSFNNAPLSKRLAVILSGALMNFLTAFITLIIVGLLLGHMTTIVGDIFPGLPAEDSNLMIGDKIVYVDGNEINDFMDISPAVTSAEENFIIQVERNGQILDIPMSKNQDNQIGVVGTRTKSLPMAFLFAIDYFKLIIGSLFTFFSSLFAGNVGLTDVSGPVGIVSMISSAVNEGLVYILLLSALININVGFFNLLPIPALDGSKALIMIIEKLTGKSLNERTESIITLIGFILLIALMIIITINDIGNFFR